MALKKIKDIIDPSNPIAAAVLPLKSDAMKAAQEIAEAQVVEIVAELEAAGWDSRIVAPFPNWRMGRAQYIQAHAKYKLLNAFCEWDYDKQPASRGMYGPCLVKLDPARHKRFVENAVKDAAAEYDAFVIKLSEKIGEVSSAVLSGNHVWSYSVLKVVLVESGEIQLWKSQQIVNVSKLGKRFLQWPSRKVKNL